MAVALVYEGQGWTFEQYEQVIERLDLGGRSAPGVLFHWVAASGDGLKAVDVFESREAADALGARLGPIIGELGLPAPAVTEYDVYATLTP